MIKYRNDIDGLRAIAVISVIIFHLGFLPNGYLGVDVFFVISGYLITSIIYKEISNDSFSILQFYIRRIRRIIPLLLFISTIAFGLGLYLMIPDDLENLAQSVVASNFSANNILMLITSADYWATKNEYKPLMHTWSLGIEEQFYLIYPFLLLLISKIRIKFIPIFLLLISILSIFLFIFYGNSASRFYLLHFRFFELSIGGLAAVIFHNSFQVNINLKIIFYSSLIFLILVFMVPYGSNQLKVISVTLLTTIVLTSGKYFYLNDPFSKLLLQNNFIVYIGKISFSLYMWHQVIFAFARYSTFDIIELKQSILLLCLTVILSIFTYHFIEKPFRNKKVISTKSVFLILGLVFLTTTSAAFYIYAIGGIYKDYPSLGLYEKENENRRYNFFSSNENINIHYNEIVRKLDKDFENTSKSKILVIGDSYGRDVVNIFLESSLTDNIQISYFDINKIKFDNSIKKRWQEADYVVISAKNFISKDWVNVIGSNLGVSIDFEKITCFGPKDYGYSNGIHYNRISKISKYDDYYTEMKDGVAELESKFKEEWGTQYVSLIEPVIDQKGRVRVFTKNGKFISQDTVHLTKFGAIFYASILEDRLKIIA